MFVSEPAKSKLIPNMFMALISVFIVSGFPKSRLFFTRHVTRNIKLSIMSIVLCGMLLAGGNFKAASSNKQNEHERNLKLNRILNNVNKLKQNYKKQETKARNRNKSFQTLTDFIIVFFIE